MTSLPVLTSERVRGHPFLKGLETRHIESLEGAAMEVEFRPSELIFRKGEPANRFYLLLDGSVVIRESDAFAFQVLHGGDVLGWSAIFPPYTSHFEAQAVEKSRAVFFYASWVLDKCDLDHDLGYELMKRMASVLVDRLQARRRARVATTQAGSDRAQEHPASDSSA